MPGPLHRAGGIPTQTLKAAPSNRSHRSCLSECLEVPIANSLGSDWGRVYSF